MEKPTPTNLLDALAVATLRIFRPLVKILLQRGVSYKTCAEWLKWCYVDVAMRDFTIEGRKQTKSRVAVLTGLTRVEVLRVTRAPAPDHSAQQEHYHRAAKVVSAWQHDPDYLDGDMPRVLDFDGGKQATFTSLVSQYSGGSSPTAIVDELLRTGCVEELPDRRLQLVRGKLIGDSNALDQVNASLLGIATGRLLNTFETNMREKGKKRRLQLMVLHPRIPAKQLPYIKFYLEARSKELIYEMDEWLHANVNQDALAEEDNETMKRAGMGFYYFEEAPGERDSG
ncbi:MAG: hypothetical protein Tsb002_30930 [Wenzhouxiangellaceae bacterium]